MLWERKFWERRSRKYWGVYIHGRDSVAAEPNVHISFTGTLLKMLQQVVAPLKRWLFVGASCSYGRGVKGKTRMLCDFT